MCTSLRMGMSFLVFESCTSMERSFVMENHGCSSSYQVLRSSHRASFDLNLTHLLGFQYVKARVRLVDTVKDQQPPMGPRCMLRSVLPQDPFLPN